MISFMMFFVIIGGVIVGGILIAVIIGLGQSTSSKSNEKKLRKQFEQQALQEEAQMQNADNPYMQKFDEQ